MSYTFEIIWPNRQKVSETQIHKWYEDARDNNELEIDEQDKPYNETLCVHSRAKALHDAGIITLRKKIPIESGA